MPPYAQPRGIRNNNPGNIEYGPFAQSAGAVSSDGRFAQFPTMDAGKQAMIKLLRSYATRGYNTPNKMINRWAPPSDGNPTQAYAADAAKAAGIGPDDPLNFGDQGQVEKFVQAMIMRENGVLPTGDSPIGVGTSGGVNQLAGGAGADQLLSKSYDSEAISDADAMISRGMETAKGAKNWLDVFNTVLSTGYGTYKKEQEGGKKKAYSEEQRKALAGAQDTMSVAKLLMASPDEATQLKGAEMMRLAQKDAREKASSFGKNAVLGVKRGPDGKVMVDADGKPIMVPVQFNDRGEAVETKLPAGVQLSDKVLQVDTGTGTQFIGANSQAPLGGPISKNVAEVEAEKVRGEAQEKGRQALPAVESRTERVIDRLTRLATSPVRERFTGMQGAWGPNLTPEARDYQGLLDEVAGNTFIAGFSDLRGAGAITEAEGLKAQAALSRLQVLGPSDAGYTAALDDAREVFEEIRRNARLRAGLKDDQAAPAAPGAAPDAGAGNFKVLRVR
jgi:hypothetical protein